jgi:hypothetical protein
MKIDLKLNTENANDEIVQLYNFINEHSIKGIKNKVAVQEPMPGSMDVGSYMPIIEMILGSSVVAAGVKGLFDIIKNYFDLRKQKFISHSDTEKNKMDQNKVEFVVETKEGEKINLKFSSFNEEERKHFFDTVDKVFSK